MENWRPIDDSKIRDVWCCPDCEDKAYVKPLWYQDNGTPVCTDCDNDMNYIGTEMNYG